jgi:hypothetical protein
MSDNLSKPCTGCIHFRPYKRILWIIPVQRNHPLCAKVRDPGTGEMAFTEIERSEAYRGNYPSSKNHCGPQGKFYQFSWPDGVPEL